MKLLEKLMSQHFAVPLLDRFLNIVGQQKMVYCGSCKAVTRHYGCSHVDLFMEQFAQRRTVPRVLFSLIVGSISNVNPAANLLGRPFRCGRCSTLNIG